MRTKWLDLRSDDLDPSFWRTRFEGPRSCFGLFGRPAGTLRRCFGLCETDFRLLDVLSEGPNTGLAFG